MSMIAPLPARGVIAIRGPDRVSFLNGLVSNEVSTAQPGQAVWAALLSPQGRYIIDFFIFADTDRLLLDTPRDSVPDLVRRLSRYRLRAAVAIDDVSELLHVHAVWNGLPGQVPITAPDPRLRDAGLRMISETALPANADATDYDAHRHGLGLPDGPPDLEPDKTLLLEAGFDELNGVSWDKGCYMGQELTARTKYRGLVKRRLVPVLLEGSAPPVGTPVLADGAEVGTLRSAAGAMALAMLRVDKLKQPLIAGNTLLAPQIPAWMRLPA